MGVAQAVADAGATTFAALPLRLDPLVKEHYFGWLEGQYPELLGRYRKSYLERNASASWQERIGDISAEARDRFGMDERRKRGTETIPHQRPAATQLMLI